MNKSILIILILVFNNCAKQDSTIEINNLNLETTFIGYSSFNVKLNNLNTHFNNAVYLTSWVDSLGNFLHSGPIRKLVQANYTDQEILISNLPVTNFETNYVLEISSKINGEEVSNRKITIPLLSAKKLPEEDLDVSIYNIQDKSINFYAANLSTEPDYSDEYNGPTRFEVYVEDKLLFNSSCGYYNGTYVPFRTITNLEPNTTYSIKIGVAYDNAPINSEYEPDIALGTYKTFNITTLTTPLSSELDSKIENITSTSFDLLWRTDLKNLMGCSPITFQEYSLQLILNGEVHSTFNIAENPITITGLTPNTQYEATLNFRYTDYSGDSYVRQTQFTVNTL